MVFQGMAPLRGTRIFKSKSITGESLLEELQFQYSVFYMHLLLTDAQSKGKGPSVEISHDPKSRQWNGNIHTPHRNFESYFLKLKFCNINAKYMAIIRRVWSNSGCSSMVIHLPGMCEVMGSIPISHSIPKWQNPGEFQGILIGSRNHPWKESKKERSGTLGAILEFHISIE